MVLLHFEVAAAVAAIPVRVLRRRLIIKATMTVKYKGHFNALAYYTCNDNYRECSKYS